MKARSERGASAVEFAIIFPILFLVIAGIVDFGRAFSYQIQLANTAREGARAAVVGTLTTAEIEDRARFSAGSIPPADLTFPSTQACPSGTGNASFTARATFHWLLLGPAIRIIGGSGPNGDYIEYTAVMKCGG